MASHIRFAIRKDIPQLVEIEKHGPAPHWDEWEFVAEFKDRHTIARVIVDGNADNGPVVGFVVYRLERLAIVVVNLAVHEDYRRRGYGRQLLTAVIEKLSPTKRTAVLIRVHEKNIAAQRFLRKCGFSSETVARGAYDDGKSDGYDFAFRLVKPALFKNRISSLLKE